MRYFLDSNTIISYLRGSSVKTLQNIPRESLVGLYISSVVLGELLTGAYKSAHPKRESDTILSFAELLNITPYCDKCALIYARTRAKLEKKGCPIGPNDLIIAATALAHEGVLVTNNTREFSRVEGLRIEDWTK